MISNPILEIKRTELLKEKTSLSIRKAELESELKALAISPNKARKRSADIDESVWKYRDACVKEIKSIDKKMIVIKIKGKEYYDIERSEKNRSLINLFKEIFSNEQMDEINLEATRRANGEHPFKLSFNVQDCIKIAEERNKYKKELIKQIDIVIGFRIKLTQLIDKGCEQFGKSEFLTFISPLNRQILPIQELETIKRKIIG